MLLKLVKMKKKRENVYKNNKKTASAYYGNEEKNEGSTKNK